MILKAASSSEFAFKSLSKILSISTLPVWEFTEKEKNWKEEKGKAIIDALADDGVTYGEAQAIIKAAEWELGKRRYEDKLKKE